MTTRETDTSHGDWMQYYQSDPANQPHGGGGTTLDFPLAYSSTAVTTTIAPAGSSGGAGEGRVGKAASRRRSRASRKPPPNLINTDAANFRDMVQRYTGAPQGTFQAGYLGSASAGGAGAGAGPTTLSFSASGGTVLPQQPAAFPYGAQQQEQQQYLQYQQHHERRPFAMGGGAGDADDFLQRFGGGHQQRGDVEVSEGYLMEGISSSQVLPSAPASGGGRNTSGFFFDES